MTDTIVTTATLEKSPHGCDCTFVKIGNAGMKIYRDYMDREDQYKLQGLFHKIGLAPECWFSFDFKGPNGDMLYAYYSELAEVRGPEDWDEYDNLACEMKEYIGENYGIEWTDAHSGNVGKLNGRTVIIDFGYMHGTEVLR